MERIGLAGYSIRRAGAAELERLKRPAPEDAERFCRDLADDLAASELVLLATCNRVEVVFRRENGALPGPADARVVADAFGLSAEDSIRDQGILFSGVDAARHLLRVACSLDSLVVGEDQILAQVRAAWERCEALDLVGERVRSLFEHAIQVGKRVRSETAISSASISVVSLGVARLIARLRDADAPRSAPRVAVIGAGETGALAARSLASAGIAPVLVANRTREKALTLAQEFGARVGSLDDLRQSADRAGRAELRGLDAVVSATGAPGHVLTRTDLLALAREVPDGRPLLGIDLAMPRDLEPVEGPEVELVDLESLRVEAEENRARRRAAVIVAERMIEEKLAGFRHRSSERRLAAALREIMSESTELFEHELRGLFEERLAHLDPSARTGVERWARRTFGRLAHIPVSALKDLVHYDPEFLSHAEGDTTG